tara:strand:+ start:2015 stop:2824 length:810 start_codon:yes stop_codon:yes gene_type:complete
MQLLSHTFDDRTLVIRSVLLAVTAIFCLLWAVPSLSKDLLQTQIQEPVRFATSTVKPWGIRTAAGDQGLLVAVIDEMVRITKVSVSNQLQPYPRVVHSVYSGFVDFAFLFDSPATEASAIRIGHLVDSKMIVVGRAGSQKLNSLDELSGKSVGFIRGSKYGSAFDDATHFDRVPVSSMEQGLAMLMRDRMDVMAGTDQAVYWSMRKMNVGARRLTKLYVLNGTSGSLYISKKSSRTDLIPVFREALLTLKENGTIDRIFQSDYQWADTP